MRLPTPHTAPTTLALVLAAGLVLTGCQLFTDAPEPPSPAEPVATQPAAPPTAAALPPDPALTNGNTPPLGPNTAVTPPPTPNPAPADVLPATNTNAAQLTPAQLQQAVRNFADQYRQTIASACDAIVVAADDDPDLRRRAQYTKINGATAMYDIAVDPVPASAALNAAVLVSLQANFLRDHGQQLFDQYTPQLLQRAEFLQREAFKICATFMNEQQSRDLLDKVNQWSAENPGVSDIWYVRLDDLPGTDPSETVAQMVDRFTDLPKRFFNKFNPFSIDQAQTSVAEAQLLAERVSWLAPRLMILAQWRAEAVVYDSIANTRLPEALDLGNRFATVAENLPDTLDQQREALVRDLTENQPQLTELLTESQRLFGHADALLQTADAFTARIQQIQETAYANERPPNPDAPPARPFDITEYTEALKELQGAMVETNNLLLNANDVTSGDLLDERVTTLKSAARSVIWTAAAATLIVGLLLVLAVKFIPPRRRPT
ncbi:MAG: hypothetical protein AAF333_09030 [Planctomycetota bacterium]